GVAGNFPLDHNTIYKIGHALGTVLQNSSSPVRVVLGKDTRESKDWISSAIATGLAATGAEVLDAGVITTPGAAYLTRPDSFSAGVMVSASHNPSQDNGIKIFTPQGNKLPVEKELEIESLMKLIPDVGLIHHQTASPVEGCVDEYVEYLASLIPEETNVS